MPEDLAALKTKVVSYRKLLASVGDDKTRRVLSDVISDLHAVIQKLEPLSAEIQSQQEQPLTGKATA